jgi:uncharacterized membrane protein (UPF0127 family)
MHGKQFILFLSLTLGTVMLSCGERQQKAPEAKAEAAAQDTPNFTREGDLDLLDSAGKVVKTIEIEIADSEFDRERGLMYRPYLPESAGMLFIFGREEYRSFWMRNTYISLDIMFIGASGEINTIHKYTTPYSEASIPSKEPSTYVLEVNAGFCDNHDITEGMSIAWRRNSDTSVSEIQE